MNPPRTMKQNVRKYTFHLRKFIHSEDGSIRMEAEVSPNYWREPKPWALLKAELCTDGIFVVSEYELSEDAEDAWCCDERIIDVLNDNERACMTLFFMAREYDATLSIIIPGDDDLPEIRVPAPAVQVAIAAEAERRKA